MPREPRLDPIGWLARWIPLAWIYDGINLFMAGVAATFCGFLVVRRRTQYAFAALWWAELAVYAMLLAGFLFRRRPLDRARGVIEICLPLLGGIWPFFLLLLPVNPELTDLERRACFWLMTVATGWMALSFAFLMRSFSITIEARALVTRGPYQWIRHPVYVGELAAVLGVALLRWGVPSIVFWLEFAAIQFVRAALEERKLSRHFPEYAEYKRRTGMLLPRLRR